MTACPLCRQRKARRACPAKGVSICSHCCGTKRRVEIDCPPDCVYLEGAHAAGWGRETERRRDARRLAPYVQRLAGDQTKLFFFALVGINGLRHRRRDLTDAMLAQAVGAVRKTAQTRTRGILYEHPADDLRAQSLVGEVRGIFESKDASGAAVTPSDQDLIPVLEALEGALGETVREAEGPTAFLDTVARVVGSRPAASTPAQPRIIVEP